MRKLVIFMTFTCLAVFVISSQSMNFVQSQIPILGWYGVSPSENTSERFKEQAAAGITYNFTVYPNIDSLAAALDAALDAGIKIIINCPELKTTPEKVVLRFQNHPALAGYYLKDEPGAALFPELAEWVRKIQAIDNTHFCYINLFPNYATNKMLGVDSYKEYVNLFVKEVPVQFISFDHYPIIINSLGTRFIRKEWYENLEIIALEGKKANKPFWAFVLTTAHGAYPIPTLAEIKLQVFSNLAYGAQGIQYFTYWTPSDANLNFRNGPIDNITKKKTDIYFHVKKMNDEINNLMQVFYNSRVISVEHMGPVIPEGTKELKTLPRIFKKLKTNNANIIISQLKNNQNSYVVIVNKDFQNEINIEVQLASSSVKRVFNNGSIIPVPKSKNIISIPSGDVLIYTYKN